MSSGTEIKAVLSSRYSPENGEMTYMLAEYTYGLSDTEFVIDTNFSVFIETPKISKKELAKKAIETLREKQRVVLAEAHQRELELQAQIDNLLRLPFLSGDER